LQEFCISAEQWCHKTVKIWKKALDDDDIEQILILMIQIAQNDKLFSE